MNFEHYCSLWGTAFKNPVHINYRENMIFFEYTDIQDLLQNDLSNPFILLKRFPDFGFYSGEREFFDKKYSSCDWKKIVDPLKCRVFLNR